MVTCQFRSLTCSRFPPTITIIVSMVSAIMAKDARSDEETPLNPWKTTDARQISEQVSGFVKRLPPPSPITPPSDRSPWYWIAHPNRSAYVDDRADLGDVVSFVCEGRALLEEYEQRRSQVVTERHLDETPGQSQQLRDAIWEAARKWKVVCGKVRYTVTLPAGLSSRCSPVQ